MRLAAEGPRVVAQEGGTVVELRADGADLLVSDVTAALQAGSGCQQEAMTMRCPLGATFGGVADLGDGDDTMTVDSRFGGASVSVDGGAGDELLTGEGSGGDDFTALAPARTC